MDQNLARFMVAAVVGAGVVIGTAGLFLYNEIYSEKRRVAMQQRELNRLGATVAELRAELVDLQSRQKLKRTRNRSARSETDSEYSSFPATDDEDEEFFDISDEDATVESSDPVLARFLQEVDPLLSGDSEDKREAYRLLCDRLDEFEDKIEVQWRIAKACSNMASIYTVEENREKRQQAIEEGLSHALKALAMDEECADAHKWYAILIGSRSEFSGIKEKITDGHVFKQHVDRALELSPRDFSLHHLLGRFKYEVASLSWFERKMASTLFAEPPTAEMSEAVADLLSAEELSPTPWKMNRVLLAKCLLAQSEQDKAVMWLEQAVDVPVKTADDETAHKEALELLSRYNSVRS